MCPRPAHNVADILWKGPGSEIELLSMNVQQSISGSYVIHAQVKSPSPSLAFGELLKQETRIVLMCGPELTDERIFSGIITRLAKGRTRHGQLGKATGQNYFYDIEIRPKLWLLTKRFRSKVFQTMTVQDIVNDVLGEYGITNSWNITGTLLNRSYCIQYEETDYHFMSRLLEDEGIWFYFDQEAAEVIFSNDHGARPDSSPSFSIPYIEEVSPRMQQGKHEYISDFTYSEQVGTARFSVDHYNHETSQTKIDKEGNEGEVASFGELESYEHSQNYEDASEADYYVGLRKEESVTGVRRGSGTTGCRSFEPGYLMEMTDHFRSELNTKWFLTSCNMVVEQGHFRCYFSCIQAEVPFRPSRKTPKPKVFGFQTGIVTGPPGAEVYLDDLGRCKVQFHWDREGKSNDRSSIWVRVSNGYGGKDYGIQWTPRVGNEVLINFIDGDPDQPLIMGRVYNDFNTPPLGPTKKYQNIIKSIKNHHLMFDDKDGKEQVSLRSQKDLNIEVMNDMTTLVGHDQELIVKNDQDNKIKGNQTTTVTKNQVLNVTKNQTQTITEDRTVNVTKNETTNVTLDKTTVVKKNMITTVTDRSAVTAKRCELNTDGANIGIGSGQLYLGTGTDGGQYSIWINGTGISLIHGSSGDLSIRIKSSQMSLEHTTKIELKVGTSKITVEPTKVTVNATNVEVNGTAEVKITGGVIKMNC